MSEFTFTVTMNFYLYVFAVKTSVCDCEWMSAFDFESNPDWTKIAPVLLQTQRWKTCRAGRFPAKKIIK